MRRHFRAWLRPIDSRGYSPEARRAFPAALSLPFAFALFAWMLLGQGAAAAPKKKGLPSKPIDLNHATLEQLEQLPGVGPVMAASILKFRQQSGAFERVDDLLAIRGISRRRFEKIRPYVYVGKQSAGRSFPSRNSSEPSRRASTRP
jgi:competence ComEA-like helix-hairpin-helix protein